MSSTLPAETNSEIVDKYGVRHIVVEELPYVFAPTPGRYERHERARAACGQRVVERWVGHAGEPTAYCRPCWRATGRPVDQS